jgi:hypothetical protein
MHTQVWTLAGAPTPFVLRPLSNSNYRLGGETFVLGIMRGEQLKEDRLIVFGTSKSIQVNFSLAARLSKAICEIVESRTCWRCTPSTYHVT